MPNIRSKIKGHYKKLLQPKPTKPQMLSKYFVKENCPMNRICLTSSILYEATRKCSDSRYKHRKFKGIFETTFKKNSFKKQKIKQTAKNHST